MALAIRPKRTCFVSKVLSGLESSSAVGARVASPPVITVANQYRLVLSIVQLSVR